MRLADQLQWTRFASLSMVPLIEVVVDMRSGVRLDKLHERFALTLGNENGPS
jgi:hypothetical protein